jgi:hypothetical protein
MSEWTPYKIAFPNSSRAQSQQGNVLETVYHVAHVSNARRILEDGRLTAKLVYDESWLRKSRISVTWLSANTWANGSIYGNVQFAFPWTEIKRQRFYWVEAMTHYSPHAYRILLTDRDLSHSKHVREYHPSCNRGPLRERSGVWYWNDQCTSEFLIENDIDLEDCTAFDFVGHHSSICRLNRRGCSDMSASREQTGGRVLAFLLGNGIHSIDHVLKMQRSHGRGRSLKDTVDKGIDGIVRALGGGKDRFGGAIKSATSGRAVSRGALALYGSGQRKAARKSVALLNSSEVFERAITDIVNGHFGLTRWEIE